VADSTVLHPDRQPIVFVLDNERGIDHSEGMRSVDDPVEGRSLWRSVFLVVEAPNFTGYEARRARRSLGMFIVGVLALIGAALVMNTWSGTGPTAPTYPPLTFVTLPAPEPDPGG
jgi:hypothetical protein